MGLDGGWLVEPGGRHEHHYEVYARGLPSGVCDICGDVFNITNIAGYHGGGGICDDCYLDLANQGICHLCRQPFEDCACREKSPLPDLNYVPDNDADFDPSDFETDRGFGLSEYDEW